MQRRSVIQTWAPGALRDAAERAARDADLSLSAFLREILVVELTRRQYYPPPPSV